MPLPRRIRQDVVSLTGKPTGRRFTPNVPSDVAKDLLLQDAIIFRLSDRSVAFAVVTCLDGALQITLLGTDPELRGRGIGKRVIEAVRSVALEMGIDTVRATSTPPEANPAYAPTLAFYQKQGFRVKRRYTELWEHGAIELELRLGPTA